jgi:UPF0755 protein
MSKRSFRIALAVVAGTIAILIVVGIWFVNAALSYPDERHGGTGKVVEVEIKNGMAFPRVASLLAEKKIIEKPTWFRLYAMWRGDTTSIKSGTYLLADNLRPRDVLDTLVAGVKEVTVSVTLPEGKHMLEYFEELEKAGVAKASELEALARNKEFLAAHAIVGETVDGYLFPDTYRFVVPDKPAKVLERLIQRHQKVWNEIVHEHGRSLAKLKEKMKWSDRDVITMASIVEKEAVEPTERPRISQVFVNRLTSPTFKPKKLETDPTIRYGCMVPLQKSAACKAWDRSDRLHRAQLDDKDNPYNTYQHEGLPPGPICNPGRASIIATITPDGSDYYYFVAKNPREHVFSRTYDEHARAVEKYQK